MMSPLPGLNSALDPSRMAVLTMVRGAAPRAPDAGREALGSQQSMAAGLMSEPGPASPVEALLATDAVAAHFATMDAWRRAIDPAMPNEVVRSVRCGAGSMARLSAEAIRMLQLRRGARARESSREETGDWSGRSSEEASGQPSMGASATEPGSGTECGPGPRRPSHPGSSQDAASEHSPADLIAEAGATCSPTCGTQELQEPGSAASKPDTGQKRTTTPCTWPQPRRVRKLKGHMAATHTALKPLLTLKRRKDPCTWARALGPSDGPRCHPTGCRRRTRPHAPVGARRIPQSGPRWGRDEESAGAEPATAGAPALARLRSPRTSLPAETLLALAETLITT